MSDQLPKSSVKRTFSELYRNGPLYGAVLPRVRGVLRGLSAASLAFDLL